MSLGDHLSWHCGAGRIGPCTYGFEVRGELESENDLSTSDLFARVLEDLRDDEDTRLAALVALHGRPTRTVIARSLALCASEEPFERTVGLRVLRELRHPTVSREVLWEPIDPVVVRLATDEDDPAVLQHAISCWAFQPGGRAALAAVLGRADHPNSAVRFAVAYSLPALGAIHGGEAPVEALIKLTRDDDADVRSYALMGLVDDLGLAQDLREVVEARLADTDDQIRRVAREALAKLTD